MKYTIITMPNCWRLVVSDNYGLIVDIHEGDAVFVSKKLLELIAPDHTISKKRKAK